MRYSSGDDLSSLAVNAEGQMARFVAKTLTVCNRRTELGTEANDTATEKVSFDNEHRFEVCKHLHLLLGCIWYSVPFQI